MTRSELLQKLSNKFPHLKPNDIEKITNIFFETIAKALVENRRAEFRGFGAFYTKQRKSWLGRNPRDGSKVEIPSKRFLFFRLGKDLFNRFNSDSELIDKKLQENRL